jgi:hypothetical protein
LKTPFVLVVVRVGNLEDTEIYSGGVRAVFTGGETTGLVASDLLQPTEVREIHVESLSSVGSMAMRFLAKAIRVLVVVLNADSGVDDKRVTAFEGVLSRKMKQYGVESYRMVNVMLKSPDKLLTRRPRKTAVRLGLGDLDERDLQVPLLRLYALHTALGLFVPSGEKVELFFSHAKRDGVALATATLAWLNERLKGFSAFYDNKDLDKDGDLDAQLSEAVANAIVVVFRSDVFDQRFWCQKEVIWAEQFGRPVVTVDARWQIEHMPSVINFDSTPVVRIPDGSLIRVLEAALVEGLRVALFRGRVSVLEPMFADTTVAIPRFPSLVSLDAACEQLATKRGPSFIVYPNPSLPSRMAEAADALARGRIKDCTVGSLDEYRLTITR